MSNKKNSINTDTSSILTKNIDFHALSPINTADIGAYEDALLWALRNRKKEDIKNVAITGPYGSGKSSILKTFQKKYENEFHFLSLSLATFKEELEKDGENHQNHKGDSDILRLIELSILQQIFYHEEDKTIPDSRFKKIKSYKRSDLRWTAFGILMLIISGFNIFAPTTFASEFHLSIKNLFALIIHIVCLGLFAIGTYIILLRSIRLVNSVRISKLKFQDAEIEVDKSISKSVLNNHLDEIIYFFEVTKYTVVIIEDLDRFQQTEIFTKLRELNLLINNSKKTKREIVFIYAVRDDMFKDKDRIKFFDFIIPIIPVINSFNSNDKLRNIRNHNYKITEELIDDVSLFIDDLRLLYNIENEYYMYSAQLDNKLDPNKLLSMIVYKNIYPNDFVELSQDKGNLYDQINSRVALLKIVIEELDEQIEALKPQIKEIESSLLKNVNELRRVYLAEIVSTVENFGEFIINGNSVKLQEATTDVNFEYFLKDQVQCHYFKPSPPYHISTQAYLPKFVSIEQRIDPKQTYRKREELLNELFSNKSEALKHQIDRLEIEKAITRNKKLADLIKDKLHVVKLPDPKQQSLVGLLLRNGYIDEDYRDYISIFYEGSITKEDRQFLLNVKSGIQTDFDHKLSKVNKLIPKIAILHFSEVYILNYNLLDYLIELKSSGGKLEAIIGQLSDNSEQSLVFINGYIDVAGQLDKFIKLLAHAWSAYWNVITNRDIYTTERKEFYYQLLLAHADVSDIAVIAKESDLGNYISKDINFVNRKIPSKKLGEIANELSVELEYLPTVEFPNELFEIIYQEWLYAITSDNIVSVMTLKGKYEKVAFETNNYYFINHSGLDDLINNINYDLNEYLENVYFKFEGNGEEDEEQLIALIGNQDISEENKIKLIQRAKVEIGDLSLVNSDYYAELLNQSVVLPDWKNIWIYFKAQSSAFDSILINYMNEETHADRLLEKPLPSPDGDEEEILANDFLDAMLIENGLNDDIYNKYLGAVDEGYEELSFEGLNDKKVTALIDHRIIELSVENFDYLKKHFHNLLEYYCQVYQSKLITVLQEFAFEDDEVIFLLNARLDSESKYSIYLTVSAERMKNDKALGLTIARLLIENLGWAADNTQLKTLLNLPFPILEKVQLFNTRFRQFDKSEVLEILSQWPYPYSHITKPGKRPLLEHDQENHFFGNNLKTLGVISKSEVERHGVRISTFKGKGVK